jgi:hypothetical protein
MTIRYLHPTLHLPLTALQQLRLMNRRRTPPQKLPPIQEMVDRMNADQAAEAEKEEPKLDGACWGL